MLIGVHGPNFMLDGDGMKRQEHGSMNLAYYITYIKIPQGNCIYIILFLESLCLIIGCTFTISFQ